MKQNNNSAVYNVSVKSPKDCLQEDNNKYVNMYFKNENIPFGVLQLATLMEPFRETPGTLLKRAVL